jgi:hypothetical protein
MGHEQEEISCDLALLHVAEMEKIAALFRHETCKNGLASDTAYHDGAQVDSRRGKGGHHDCA